MTHTLSQSLIQLRELIHGGAEKIVTLALVDSILRQLPAQHRHVHQKIEQLQKDLKSSKKEAKNLKKQVNCLKGTIQCQSSDLEMMNRKNKNLHSELMKLQQKEYKKERKEDRKGSKETKDIEIGCDLISTNFVDNICQLYKEERRNLQLLQEQNGQLQHQLQQLRSNAACEQYETSTLHDSDFDEEESINSVEQNPEQQVGKWHFQASQPLPLDVNTSRNIVVRCLSSIGNFFTNNSNQRI